MGKYRSLGVGLDRQYRNDLNANFEDIDKDIKAEINRATTKENELNKRVSDLITGTPQPSEVVDARGGYPVLRDRLENNESLLAQSVHYSSGKEDDIFVPPTQNPLSSYVSSGDPFLSGSLSNLNDFLNLFKNLATENSGYITRIDVGKTPIVDTEWIYYTFTPEKYTKTVIIGAGMHGGEKLGIVSLYNFLKLLCEKWKDYPQLAYIRNNIRLIVMPIQNPDGVYYNSRQNGNNVDINRNFDYLWNEFQSSEIFNKGTAPNSEFETQNIVNVLNQYSDAVAYIDIHNLSTGDRTYPEVSFIPKRENFPVDFLRETTFKISGKNTEVGSSTNPSGFCYAMKNYNMVSFNPEYCPGQISTAYDSIDMTYALKWFGNLIINICKLESKATDLRKYEPKVISKSWRYGTAANAPTLPLSSYADVTNSAGTVPINFTGYAKLTFQFTIMPVGALDTARHFFLPVMYQNNSTSQFKAIGTDGTTITTYQNHFENYIEGNKRMIVNVQAIIPINAFEGNLNYKLMAYTDTTEVRVMRFNRTLELIPSKNLESEFTGVLA